MGVGGKGDPFRLSPHHAPQQIRKTKKRCTKAGAEWLRRPWSGGEVSKEEERKRGKQEEEEGEEGRVESLCSLAGKAGLG